MLLLLTVATRVLFWCTLLWDVVFNKRASSFKLYVAYRFSPCLNPALRKLCSSMGRRYNVAHHLRFNFVTGKAAWPWHDWRTVHRLRPIHSTFRFELPFYSVVRSTLMSSWIRRTYSPRYYWQLTPLTVVVSSIPSSTRRSANIGRKCTLKHVLALVQYPNRCS